MTGRAADRDYKVYPKAKSKSFKGRHRAYPTQKMGKSMLKEEEEEEDHLALNQHNLFLQLLLATLIQYV